MEDKKKRPQRGKYHKLSVETKNQIIEKSLNEGKSPGEISNILGVKRKTVYNVIREFKKTNMVVTKPRGGVRKRKPPYRNRAVYAITATITPIDFLFASGVVSPVATSFSSSETFPLEWFFSVNTHVFSKRIVESSNSVTPTIIGKKEGLL